MVNSSSISITPSQHADRHVIGGDDPLVNPLLLHATRHNPGGDDEIAPILHTRTYGLSDGVLVNSPASKTTTATSYVKLKEIVLQNTVPDTIRIKFSITGSNFGYGRIYRNGVAVGVEREANSGTFHYSEDIAGWSVDDLLQVYGYRHATATSCTIFDVEVLGVYGAPVVNIGSKNELEFTIQDP